MRQINCLVVCALALTALSNSATINKTEDEPPSYELGGKNVVSNTHIISIIPGRSRVDRDIEADNLADRSRNTQPREKQSSSVRDEGMQLCRQKLTEKECSDIDYIITRESGWRVGIQNSEGCGGLGQACPTSKMGSAYGSLDGELEWTIKYAKNFDKTSKKTGNKYVGIHGARQFWEENKWY